MGHGADAAVRVEGDAADEAAHQKLAAGDADGAGERAREPLRAALHVASAALK